MGLGCVKTLGHAERVERTASPAPISSQATERLNVNRGAGKNTIPLRERPFGVFTQGRSHPDQLTAWALVLDRYCFTLNFGHATRTSLHSHNEGTSPVSQIPAQAVALRTVPLLEAGPPLHNTFRELCATGSEYVIFYIVLLGAELRFNQERYRLNIVDPRVFPRTRIIGRCSNKIEAVRRAPASCPPAADIEDLLSLVRKMPIGVSADRRRSVVSCKPFGIGGTVRACRTCSFQRFETGAFNAESDRR